MAYEFIKSTLDRRPGSFVCARVRDIFSERVFCPCLFFVLIPVLLAVRRRNRPRANRTNLGTHRGGGGAADAASPTVQGGGIGCVVITVIATFRRCLLVIIDFFRRRPRFTSSDTRLFRELGFRHDRFVFVFLLSSLRLQFQEALRALIGDINCRHKLTRNWADSVITSKLVGRIIEDKWNE